MMRQIPATLSPAANSAHTTNEYVNAARLGSNPAAKKAKATPAPAAAPQVAPAAAASAPLRVPGVLITGDEMRAAIRETYNFNRLADLDKCVGGGTVQLPMLLDQLPIPHSCMSRKAQVELRFLADGGKVRLSDLACIKGFAPHTIVKSPTAKKTPEYKAWQSYTPPQYVGKKFDRNVYAFVGQFPMALSAESICNIFFIATGIMPRCVDHLPKGAKVFLDSWEEVERAARWNQTMQVTEYGTLFTALPETPAEDINASRDQLMLMRREVDLYFRRLAAVHDPYGTVLTYSKTQAAKMADGKNAKAAEKAHKAGDKAPAPVLPAVARFGAAARNGTYPMTIEAPKSEKKA